MQWTARAFGGLAIAAGASLGLALVESAHAQEKGEKPTSYAPVDIHESFASILSRMKAAKAGVMKRQMTLLEQRYDLADRPAAGVDDDARARPFRRACAPACRRAPRGSSSRRSSPAEIRTKNAVPGRLPPAAASEPSRRRHALSAVPHRRDQAAGGPRPDALRPRLRSPGSPAARVPGADLPDHAARSRRRLAGQAGHHRQLLRALQRRPESEADRGAPAAAHAVPAAAVQPDRGPPLGAAQPGRGVPRLPCQRPHQRRRPTWWATSARRSSATASTRPRCAA